MLAGCSFSSRHQMSTAQRFDILPCGFSKRSNRGDGAAPRGAGDARSSTTCSFRTHPAPPVTQAVSWGAKPEPGGNGGGVWERSRAVKRAHEEDAVEEYGPIVRAKRTRMGGDGDEVWFHQSIAGTMQATAAGEGDEADEEKVFLVPSAAAFPHGMAAGPSLAAAKKEEYSKSPSHSSSSSGTDGGSSAMPPPPPEVHARNGVPAPGVAEREALELVEALTACADSLAACNHDAANYYLARLGETASPAGPTPMHRVAAYFAEALALRVVRMWPHVFDISPPRELTDDAINDDDAMALRRAREVDPVFEPFTIDEEVSHLTRIRSEPCHSIRGGAVHAGRKRAVSTFELLSARESGRSGAGGFSSADRAYACGKHLPTKGPWCVDDMDSEAYVSQFSSDGSLLVAGFRGSRIRIYDSEKGWKVHKDISCRSLRWTVSDIALSPDQRYLAYSSLSPIVHIVNVQSAGKESHANVTEIHDGLEFCNDDDYSFGIFSVKFSKDGREVVVGNNDSSIYVYDLGANKVSDRIRAHEADVNAVTFADESGNVLYSGSDDNLCKVWDRRCLVREKPAGVLTGHLDGITFIDSRGDGRYFISNCKDQTIKLWDVRKMSSTMKGRPLRLYDWDYRWMAFPPEAGHYRHPDDQSLATYRGHSVLQTLIRCYFSPMHSTGQRYIYTGSSDEAVYIYDVITGKTVERLSWHGSIVRDCTWHPYHPTLVSSSWDGYLARWEASGNDEDPSMLKGDEQRTSPYPQTHTLPFML